MFIYEITSITGHVSWFYLLGYTSCHSGKLSIIVLRIKHAKSIRQHPSRYSAAVIYFPFLSLILQLLSLSDLLCLQLIKFYRSHFEWLDKVKCRLDWACGFVTQGAYVPGLGLVECPGEHSCQFGCCQDEVLLHSLDFFFQYQILFFFLPIFTQFFFSF